MQDLGLARRDRSESPQVSTLVRQLQMDTRCYARDDRLLTYNVTENVKVSLLAAAKRHQEEEYGPAARNLGDDAVAPPDGRPSAPLPEDAQQVRAPLPLRH